MDREQKKKRDYLLHYGTGPKALSNVVKISKEDAKKLVDKYKKAYKH